MLKNIIKGAVIGGAALTMMATAAQAQTYQINIYGASAQYKFWNDAAPEFLKSQGCAEGNIYTAKSAKGKVAGVDRDTGISVCVGSGGDAIDGMTGAGFTHNGVAGNSLIVRYTSKASYDGVRSILGDVDPSLVPTSDQGCATGERLQAGVAGNDWKAYGATAEDDDVASVTCLPVTVGASDVSARTFQQSSKGMKEGPLGGDYIERNIQYGVNLGDPEDEPNLYTAAQPIVVPFGFFNNVNNTAFNNMTRLMATSIYSGTVNNWGQFTDPIDGDGKYLPEADGGVRPVDLPMVVCLRHAGSGTHATLDAAIMRGVPLVKQEAFDGAWFVGKGYNTTNYYQEVSNAISEYNNNGNIKIFFNDGSSDLVRCVREFDGAVGYADYDKCKEPSTDPTSSCYNVDQMTYNGQEGTADNIRNGKYEFWAAQYLYYKNADTAKDLIDDLVAFTADNTLIPDSKQPYWSSNAAMEWKKADDFAWPVKK
ncbi:MAG: substrate-binding domain-containing protein [Desulfobacter sp.]|nr:MAG: substrate-binding domain-containing protein [Desulfobacter sp.]